MYNLASSITHPATIVYAEDLFTKTNLPTELGRPGVPIAVVETNEHAVLYIRMHCVTLSTTYISVRGLYV